MFNHVVLDIAIGIIFVFLVYSLLASAINEIIAAMIAQRGRMLLRGIQKMLNGESIYWWHNLGRLFGKSDRHLRHEDSLAHLFRKHTLFRRLSKNDKPAYLSDTQFSNILLDILHQKSKAPGTTQLFEPRTFETVKAGLEKVLDDLDNRIAGPECKDNDKRCYQNRKKELFEIFSVLLDQANGDLQRLKLLIEGWYNEMMDRVSGWYKKQTHQILFFIGLALVLLFNVDTIAIIHILSRDKKSRDALVTMAEGYIQNPPRPDTIYKIEKDSATQLIAIDKGTIVTIDSSQSVLANSVIRKVYDDARRNVDSVNTILGLGWTNNNERITPWWKKAFGLLITALAISLGATFWFDLLNKLVNLRMAGKTPDEKNKPVSVTARSTIQVNQKPPPDSEG